MKAVSFLHLFINILSSLWDCPVPNSRVSSTWNQQCTLHICQAIWGLLFSWCQFKSLIGHDEIISHFTSLSLSSVCSQAQEHLPQVSYIHSPIHSAFGPTSLLILSLIYLLPKTWTLFELAGFQNVPKNEHKRPSALIYQDFSFKFCHIMLTF